VYEPVVGGTTQKAQVIPARLAPVGPMLNVMSVDPVLVIAAGKAAPTVACHQCPTQCGRDGARLLVGVERAPGVIHGHDAGTRIAGESPHGFGSDGSGRRLRGSAPGAEFGGAHAPDDLMPFAARASFRALPSDEGVSDAVEPIRSRARSALPRKRRRPLQPRRRCPSSQTSSFLSFSSARSCRTFIPGGVAARPTHSASSSGAARRATSSTTDSDRRPDASAARKRGKSRRRRPSARTSAPQ